MNRYAIGCGIALMLSCGAGVWSASTMSKTKSTIEQRLQLLEDRAEIEQLLMNYGRALDDRDFDRYAKMFAVDGEWVGSIGRFKGSAEIKTAMENAFAVTHGATPARSLHLLTNAIIDTNGDHGSAISKWTFIRIADGKPIVANVGRYEDTLIREAGHWKFLRRVAPSDVVAVSN